MMVHPKIFCFTALSGMKLKNIFMNSTRESKYLEALVHPKDKS